MFRHSSGRRIGSFAPAVVALAILLPAAFSASAQTAPDLGPNEPIRPADTSSPRSTLLGFLADVNRLSELALEGSDSDERYFAGIRAIQALDFSTMRHGDSWTTRVERVHLLKEILDRIDLPAPEQVPGAAEATDGKLTSWAIPGTPLKITRVDAGPRAGEFLFSADTVNQLGRFYRLIADQPTRPGAVTVDQELLLGNLHAKLVTDAAVEAPLKPVDTSSPRFTLAGFIESMNRAYVLATEAQAALTAEPPTLTREEARAIEAEADALLDRAVATLDLGHVPAVLRQDIGIDTALMLKEIIDRHFLPPVETVPDDADVRAARAGAPGFFSATHGRLVWRYPLTEIEIVEIGEGPRQGEFLFSAQTVDRIGTYYEAAAGLPYVGREIGPIYRQWPSSDPSPGFLDFYVSTPGYLVPNARPFSAFIEDLPKWTKAAWGGQMVWQWVGMVVCMTLFLVFAYFAFRWTQALAGGMPSPLDSWIVIAAPVTVAYASWLLVLFFDYDLNATGTTLAWLLAGEEVIIITMIALAVYQFFRALAESLIALPNMRDRSIDASLIRIAARILGVFFGIWVIFAGVQNLGAEVIPLLAGLGVGGLAVALAVRPTLENLIGGLILYTDRPVRVGDFCSFGDMTGTVEDIGVRSTQIRGLDRTLISVPNAQFADMQIINWAHCDRMLIRTTIGLRYETTTDQLRFVLARIREMLHAHPKIDRETVRVRFADYGASSLDVGIRIYALTREWNEFHAIREDILMRINDIVTASGTGFAFPSQTLYVAEDDGLDPDRTEASLAEVQSWREAGNLPFPRLSDERMNQLEGTLDYPPRGSVEAPAQADVKPEHLSKEAAEGEEPRKP